MFANRFDYTDMEECPEAMCGFTKQVGSPGSGLSTAVHFPSQKTESKPPLMKAHIFGLNFFENIYTLVNTELVV